MSAQPFPDNALRPTDVPAFVSLGQVLSVPGPTANWLWDCFLAAGKMTLLTSLWKAGKTTLVSVLMAKMRSGGELAGRPVRPARPAVITEESPDYWAERGQRLDLAPDIALLSQPFRARPTPAEWHALLERVGGLVREDNVNVLVIDPLATFFPGYSENSAVEMMAALLPLQTLTRLGVAVLLLHHPRKVDSAVGHSPRGSGALTGHADILLELRRYPHADDDDRRRRLHGLSRFSETPRQVVIELNAERTDYAFLGDVADEEFQSNWEVVRTVLLMAAEPMTRKDILARWPPVELQPSEATLWRWLERAVTAGTCFRTGTGRCNSPFRYWLPEAQALWEQVSPHYMDPFIINEFNELPGERASPVIPPSLRKQAETAKKKLGESPQG